ncbi:MAG: serpin family protein [Gemmatimonadetes bacterium]|nr:serpin family protein [Gemmatimonadota bacterium]
MRRAFGLILCSLSGVLVACGGEPLGPLTGLPRELTLGERKLIATNNRFAFNFFKEVVRQGEPDSNVFVSPLSAAMALGMTYNGARGETQTAMAHTLGLEDLTTQETNQSFRSLIDLLRGLDPKVDFRLANSIWYRLGFVPRPEFLDVNRQYFDAEVNALDFTKPEAVTIINHWVDANTGGKIPEIIKQIEDSIVMFLINAIYFKGTWVYQFDKDRTKDEPFTPRNGAQRNVSMMHHGGGAYVGRYAGAGFQVVDLPYGASAYSMTIVLPDPGRDVDSVIAGLTPDAWGGIVDGLAKDSIIVVMPKFRLEWDDTLNGVLKALGMEIAFLPYQADLSGIAGAPGDLFISYVKQGTFVDVNEEGTEAAAATVVAIGLTSAGPQEFRVDRPFAFLIRERFSGTILFMGKIMNPAVS